jgi:hypothetical protein
MVPLSTQPGISVTTLDVTSTVRIAERDKLDVEVDTVCGLPK